MISRKNILIFLIIVIFPISFTSAYDYESSQSCLQCHTDIFTLWNNSLHATAYSNSSFQASYLTVVLDEGKEAGHFCLQCHAPVAHFFNDYDLKSPLANEGVTCWFCHSVSSINKNKNIDNYYNLDTSGTVYGPYQTSSDKGHEAKYSPLHLSAEMCRGCHEYTNENGVGILETYNEWKESPYKKEDIYCQNCHMPIMIDLTVADNSDISNYYVTAHEFRGGHSKINLTNAVNMTTDVVKSGDRLDVKIMITNAESGHKLPTGIPIRKLVLTVKLNNADNVEISSSRKVYRKVLTDKYGTIIEKASKMFVDATSIYSDNRINPLETRVENFIFVVPKGMKNYKIEAVLCYEYSRPMLKEELVRIQMAKNVIPERAIK